MTRLTRTSLGTLSLALALTLAPAAWAQDAAETEGDEPAATDSEGAADDGFEEAPPPAVEADEGSDDPIGDALMTPEELSSVRGEHDYRGTGATRVMGIDFRNSEAESQIIITTDGPVRYRESRPREQQLVLEVEDARLGSGLERRLDTADFPSAVSSISSYVSRATGQDVRLVVDLRETVDWSIEENDRGLVVTFPVPPQIAATAYSNGSSTSGGLLPERSFVADEGPQENAFARERLIGGRSGGVDGSVVGTGSLSQLGSQFDPAQISNARTINLDLVNADIHNVFRLISHVSGVNIVSSDQVEGQVTVRMIDVPWDMALAAILQAKGLDATTYGNIVRIAPIDVIRAEREEQLQTARAQLDLEPLGVLTLPLNYSDAGSMIPQIEAILSTRGAVTLDERTNTLVVRDIEDGLVKARGLVRTLDTPTPQVLIEARIVEANQTFTRALGIQWGGHLNFSPETGMPTGLFFPNSVGVSGGTTAPLEGGAGTPGQITSFTSLPTYVVDLPSAGSSGSLALNLGSLTDVVSLDARLSAAESTGEGRVISAPRITTVSNQEAAIRQGTRIPYETVSLRGTQVQFVEASLELTVTPSITQDRTIFLDIQVSNNRPDFGATVNNNPTIEIKEARTVVMVRDGDTTVIGGVFSVVESENKEMVPGLGRIPILGWLFKNSTRRLERKELLVFITPTIINRTTADLASADR